MADGTAPPGKQTKAPFKPGTSALGGPSMSFASITPTVQEEPPIEQGIDLTGKPKIIFAAGRGKTGKTTLLRWMEEVSLQRGGEAILADVDPTNATFSLYFDGVQRPPVNDPAGVTKWLSELIDHCIDTKQSAIIDLGGGDTTLRTLASEMPALIEEIEAAGLSPVMLYLLGTQPEDLAPAVALTKLGFRAKAQALVFNEFSIPIGANRQQAFARVTGSEAFLPLMESSIMLWMPKLFAADVVESRQRGFLDVRDNKVEPPVGLMDRTRVRSWLVSMDKRFSGISSWIP
jgi:hypothetical protein